MNASTHGTSYAGAAETWRDKAACRREDPALFFNADGETGALRKRRERKAKAICAECPVRAQCLVYAFQRPEKWGTWGGLTQDERATERRKWLRRVAREATVQGVRERLAETFAARAS